MSFHQALDLILERDEAAVGCTRDILSIFVMKLATGRLGNGSSCNGINMVIKDLDFEPKVDAMMRDFLDSSWWKELSKEMISKFLPCGDRSCWKTFKRLLLIASILASMQVYWASMFIIPKTVVKNIEKLLKGFLWCQGEMYRGNLKVS
uniref:Reverse transcriptase domain, reverse transcriptase zinc-binding domain protein n=1 Tax=Tanacetum cinerariifolium TaxID=118510 RepID=A0A6L2LJG7_TANCI|nr:reverse transcriptase domain, reverse transcriptase zinc-binding domain protein [Tanacetum cinerariifolium]